MKTKEQREYEQEFKRRYPCWQRSNCAGRWGFARVYDCADLSMAEYRTEHACKCARARAATISYWFHKRQEGENNDLERK